MWDALKAILSGTGECARVDWTFLRHSIAEWSALSFAFLLGVSVFQIVRPGKIQA